MVLAWPAALISYQMAYLDDFLIGVDLLLDFFYLDQSGSPGLLVCLSIIRGCFRRR